MKNFRTFHLSVEFYHQAKALSLRGNMRDQLCRAASSIPLNLAEGRGKPTTKDQVRFFSIAMGSLRECQAILLIEGLDNSPAGVTLDRLGASLYRLIDNAK